MTMWIKAIQELDCGWEEGFSSKISLLHVGIAIIQVDVWMILIFRVKWRI